MGGEAGEGFGRWGEALAGAGGGGFELRGGEDSQGACMAGGEVMVDSLLVGGWELGVDVGTELVGIEVFLRLVHRDSPSCCCSNWRRVARAREIRDMTVPMGMSRMSAMSLYLISST